MGMFDARFALTEGLRFYFDLQEGKKRVFAGLLSSLQGKDVLDFGCGCGFYTNWFGTVARSVTGVDISHASLETARSINPGPHYCEVVPADGFYDVIICADSLEFNDDSIEIVSKLCGRLRPEGILYISAPDFGAATQPFWRRLLWRLYEPLRWPHRRKVAALVRALEKGAGYHGQYRRNFNELLGVYLNDKGCAWERQHYAMSGWQKNHYLYVIHAPSSV